MTDDKNRRLLLSLLSIFYSRNAANCVRLICIMFQLTGPIRYMSELSFITLIFHCNVTIISIDVTLSNNLAKPTNV